MKLLSPFFILLVASSQVFAATLEELAQPKASWVNELPVYNRTGKLGDDPFAPENLVIENGPASKNILADGEFKGLLPQRFQLSDGPHVSALFDAATKKLFESAKMREAFCFLGSEKTSDFSHFLGVQPKAAKELAKLCEKTLISDFQRQHLSMMKSSIFDSPTFQRPKTFALVLSLSDIPKIEGFTARDGKTLVIIPRDELSVERVLRIWIHELAISFDRLAPMAGVYSSTAWSTGLNEVLGLDRYKDPEIVGDTKVRDLRCALRDPAVRYGLATERAVRFEDDIMNDLGLLAKSPALALRETSCERTIGIRAVQISALAPALQREISMQSFYEECGGVDLLKDANRRETLVSRIQLIGRTQIRVRATEPARGLCELLVEPKVGPRIPDNSRHGGPRPRIGGWE